MPLPLFQAQSTHLNHGHPRCTSHQHMHLPPAHAPPTGTQASIMHHIFPSLSHITITRSPTIISRTIQPHVHRPSKASKALYHLRPYPPTLRGCADPVSKTGDGMKSTHRHAETAPANLAPYLGAGRVRQQIGGLVQGCGEPHEDLGHVTDRGGEGVGKGGGEVWLFRNIGVLWKWVVYGGSLEGRFWRAGGKRSSIFYGFPSSRIRRYAMLCMPL